MSVAAPAAASQSLVSQLLPALIARDPLESSATAADMWLSPNVEFIFLVIYLILVFASVVALLLRFLRPVKSQGELEDRIISWWKMIVLSHGVVLAGKGYYLTFLGFVSYKALTEYLSLIPTRRTDRSVLLWAYLAAVAQYVLVWVRWEGMALFFVPVYVFLMLPFRMTLSGNTKGFLKAAGELHWGIMISVYTLSHLALFTNLPTRYNPQSGGLGLSIYTVFLTEFNDVAQYCWGRTMGRNKIVPLVSPGKTVEGFLGGVVTTALLSWLIAPLLTPFNGPEALVLGAATAAAGFVGDINISSLKRDIGIKDTGSLIPGHGGILDRVDSLTYTAPLLFHYCRWMHPHRRELMFCGVFGLDCPVAAVADAVVAATAIE